MTKKTIKEIAGIIHAEFAKLPVGEYDKRLKDIEYQLTNHITDLYKNDKAIMGEVVALAKQDLKLVKLVSNIRDVLLPYTPFAKGHKK